MEPKLTNQHHFEKMTAMAERLGVQLSSEVHQDFLQSLELNSIQIHDFLPEFILMIQSLVSKKEFAFRRGGITAIEHGILIAFNNFFEDGLEGSGGHKTRLLEELPSVQIMPLRVGTSLQLPKHSHRKIISIIVSLDFLQRLLNEESARFDFLLGQTNQFFIDQFMSADMLRVANEISRSGSRPPLGDFYYRVKALELVYFLFRDLSQRKETPQEQINNDELKAIYKVRDALIEKLNQPPPVQELVRLGGMNEQKLRKLFTQVFGIGMYDCFQGFRMREAARLLGEEKLTVSETGYRLGFSNLSHFSRLFEAYLGTKPKKWSQQQAHWRKIG